MPSYGYRLRVVCLSLSPSSETSPPTASPLVQGYATKTKALAREIPPATRAVLSETRIKLREKKCPCEILGVRSTRTERVPARVKPKRVAKIYKSVTKKHFLSTMSSSDYIYLIFKHMANKFGWN